MCKKFVCTALVIAGLLAVFGFTKAGSYAHLAWKKTRTKVTQAVPLEVEIERLKEEIRGLMPDLNKNIALVANEMASIERMEREITVSRTKLEEQKQRLVQLAQWIESGETQFVMNARVYNREQVAERMARDFEAYKRAEAELKFRERELAIKKKALESAREQLRAMKDKEQELKLQLAELEAELKAVRVAQTRSQFQLDDSRLSDIKHSLEELRTRINAERYQVELEGEFANGPEVALPAEVKPIRDLAKEIREMLQGPAVASDQ